MHTSLHFKSIPLSLAKAVDDEGNIKGYVTTFGNTDLIGDVIEDKALDEFIEQYNKSGVTGNYGKALPMLWNHSLDEPIGAWKSFEKDAMGVIGTGKLYDVSRAKDIKKILKDEDNTIGGFSIGFSANRKDMEEIEDEEKNFLGYRFNKIMLHETSVVMMPANPMAKIQQVKSIVAPEGHIRLAEIEKMLMIGGLSKKQATTVVSGVKDLLQVHVMVTVDPSGDESEEEMIDASEMQQGLNVEDLGVILKGYTEERELISHLKSIK